MCLVLFVLILSSGNMRTSQNIKKSEEIMSEMVFTKKKTNYKNDEMGEGQQSKHQREFSF